jgi:aminoglycoside 3-N-acetyltransferase
MNNYTKDDIKKMIDFFGIKNSDSVLIHSSLFMLGKMKDVESKDISKEFINILKEHLNDKGALLVPAFTYIFPKEKKIDLSEPNSEMGVLSNYVINMVDSYRSNHPIFSFSGFGAKAKYLLQPDSLELNPFNEESTFNRFTSDNGIILIMGAPLRVATYIIYCEFMSKVEYRYLKYFEGNIIQAKTGDNIYGKFYHFVFPLMKTYKHNYDVFHRTMIEIGITKKYKIGKGFAYAFRAKDFFEKVNSYLKVHPFGLLTSEPNAFYEYVDEKEKIKSK